MILEIIIGFVILSILAYIIYVITMSLLWINDFIREITKKKYGSIDLLIALTLIFIFSIVSFNIGRYFLGFFN